MKTRELSAEEQNVVVHAMRCASMQFAKDVASSRAIESELKESGGNGEAAARLALTFERMIEDTDKIADAIEDAAVVVLHFGDDE